MIKVNIEEGQIWKRNRYFGVMKYFIIIKVEHYSIYFKRYNRASGGSYMRDRGWFLDNYDLVQDKELKMLKVMGIQ